MRKKTVKKSVRKSPRKKSIFTKDDYLSNDGMMTSVWGPSLWFFLHTMSFNFPVKPDLDTKKNYRNFIVSLQHILPCRTCRENLKKNFEKLPPTLDKFKNRETFSRYIYDLHETVNKMLGKKSNLSYEDVRDRFETFRAKCIVEKKKSCKKKKSHKGCEQPFYGKKSKCVIKIIPHDKKEETFQMHQKCKLKK